MEFCKTGKQASKQFAGHPHRNCKRLECRAGYGVSAFDDVVADDVADAEAVSAGVLLYLSLKTSGCGLARGRVRVEPTSPCDAPYFSAVLDGWTTEIKFRILDRKYPAPPFWYRSPAPYSVFTLRILYVIQPSIIPLWRSVFPAIQGRAGFDDLTDLLYQVDC